MIARIIWMLLTRKWLTASQYDWTSERAHPLSFQMTIASCPSTRLRTPYVPLKRIAHPAPNARGLIDRRWHREHGALSIIRLAAARGACLRLGQCARDPTPYRRGWRVERGCTTSRSLGACYRRFKWPDKDPVVTRSERWTSVSRWDRKVPRIYFPAFYFFSRLTLILELRKIQVAVGIITISDFE